MARWTVQQVVGLAPDARSVAAARSLARPGRWSQLGATSSLVWGRCQGSGKDPYEVTVDLTEPSFRCSCPSRKFPCKHGLALLLLWVEGDGAVAELEAASPGAGSPAPASRSRPLGGRAEVDPAARAARVAARLALMQAGLDDHERWMTDLVRQGLAAARGLPYGAWDAAAARLVDAQVPRLADRVRAVGGAVHTRRDWPEHLLAELARSEVVIRGWRRRDGLPDDVVAGLRAQLGWPVASADVRAGTPLADRWHVIGTRRAGDDRVQSQRTWLRGRRHGEVVVLLDFAAGAGTLEVPHVVGALTDGEVVHYPGPAPRRAILCDGHRPAGSSAELPGAVGIDAALDVVAATLAADPLCERVLVVLAGVVPGTVSGGDGPASVLVDEAGAALPVHPGIDVGALLALGGARACDVVAEWEDGWLVPLSAAIDGDLVAVPIDDDRTVDRSALAAGGPRWEALVSAALVGTDRRPVPVEVVPVEVGPVEVARVALEPAEDGDGELSAPACLLVAAAVERARQRAGTPARTHGVRTVPPAPEERVPAAPSSAVGLLELLLGGAAGLGVGRDAVLDEWFAACGGGGRRVPHRLVAPLLDLAATDPRRRDAVLEVSGTRGRWAAVHADADRWAWVAELDADDRAARDPDAAAQRWATGTPGERRRLLAARRAHDAAAGRELLASSWSRETAAERATLVGLLRTGLGPDDEPFLEAALADRAKGVRAAAASLLDHLSASRRADRCAARVEGLLRVSDGPGGRTLAVELPGPPDRAAAADLPGARPPRGLGERAWQLAELVAAVPLDRWAAWVDPDPRAVIAAADARAELVAGWTTAAAAQRRPDWAAALLVHRVAPELVAVLAPADAAGAVGWLLDVADPTAVPGLLAAVDGPWPVTLVERLLTWVDARPVAPATALAVADLLAARAAPRDADVIERALVDRREQDAVRRALRGAHHALTLRAAVDAAFADPPEEHP